METLPSGSSRFRQALKQELPLWRTRGLMDDVQIQALTDLYRLDLVCAPTQRRFVSVLVFFGVLLVGLGVLSFVAANWEFIPTALKVALLLGAMWGAQGSGFYLERSGRSPALGHGLIVLGSLLYGANIGLFGQIFQLQGELHQALFLWGIGVLAVAYALPSLPNAALALVVLLGGYLDWSWGSNSGTVLPLLPVVGLALFLPLSYRLRSPGFYQWSVLLAGVG
ncbi:MAG: DUF2157 domain-containing protein, partial [Gemmatimonadaceae bacterium]|nr:DUF2157 domain-containing protein [Gloeobacterales cyanobacterium ES-bin-141]